VTSFALRPRRKGETTVVDEIVSRPPRPPTACWFPRDSRPRPGPAQRHPALLSAHARHGDHRRAKLDNYQNFAKAFRVADYAAVMASIKPNAARLKTVTEFKPRDLTDRTEIGPTPLGAVFIALQEFMADRRNPKWSWPTCAMPCPTICSLRPVLIDMADFIAAKARQPETAAPPRPSPAACATSGCRSTDMVNWAERGPI
jgi:putative DNA methylase